DNPYMTVYAMKFDEVQKYITNIRYIFSIEPLIVSEQVFQSLSPEEQAAVLEAGNAATLASGQFLRDQEARIKEELVAKGMEITDPADGEQEFIDLATTAVWPKIDHSIGGKDVLNNVLPALGRPAVECPEPRGAAERGPHCQPHPHRFKHAPVLASS